MKRSDVIDGVVYSCLSWDGLDTSGVPVEEIANDILTYLEQLGMLPPTIEFELGGKIVKDNAWETENEEK